MNKHTLEYWKSQLDEIWLDSIKLVHRNKDIDKVIEYAYIDLLSQPDRINTASASDFKRLVNSWLSNRKPELTKVKPKRDISNL